MKIIVTPHYCQHAVNRTQIKIEDADGKHLLYVDVNKAAKENTFLHVFGLRINIQFHHISIEAPDGVFVWNEFEHRAGMTSGPWANDVVYVQVV